MKTTGTDTIQRKLTKVILLVCATSLLLVSATFVAFYTVRAWKSTVAQTLGTCRLIAENSRASLDFESPGDAQENLNGLALQPEFLEAAIYDKHGVLFAAFTRAGATQSHRSATLRNGHALEGSDLVMFEPITHDGTQIGTIYVRRECSDIQNQVLIFGAVGLGAMFIVLGVAYALARKLQGPITDPILKLAQAATMVAERKDFSTRVQKTAEDEIGVLFDGFNAMLSEIENRDSQLEKHRQELESRVAARTIDLKFSEARYRMLFESNPLPMWVYDIDTRRFLAVNESAVNHYGYTRAEFLSMTVDVARAAEDMIIHYRADGSVIQVETVGHSLMFEDRPARLISVNDVTARKKAETDLKTANEKLIDVSRRAGMAEVATGVLHNVGNVLNSVNVAATIIAERTQSLRVESLSRAANLIDENGGKPEFFASAQGRAVPNFLKKLADHFGTQRDFLCGEIESLTRNVEHIKQIVSMQQSYATTAGVVGPVEVGDLISDSLKLVAGSLGRHKIEVTQDIRHHAILHTDRHRVLQIIVNLLRNAAQAMRNTEAEKRITITVDCDEQTVRIAVSDKGCGISGENLTRIFNHGFTTKTDGHGFGLHGGALAAKELGGSLIATSNGPGTGATFTLELPLQPITHHETSPCTQ